MRRREKLDCGEDKMSDQKVVRPGVTVLLRMVVSAREQAQEETYHRLNFLITEERKVTLDQLLITDETKTWPWGMPTRF